VGILDELLLPERWEEYYSFKEKNLPRSLAEALRRFIDRGEYRPVVMRILEGGTFSPPRRRQIKKSGTRKLRTVFSYSPEENLVLKLIAYLLRRYDGIFSPDLYSFRENRGVGVALSRIMSRGDICRMYTYKADVSDYFNSIPVERLLPELREALADDPALYKFLASLLEFPYSLSPDGIEDSSPRGVMAGCATSSFLANLYLSCLDERFCGGDVIYARYSDDIMVLADTGEARAAAEDIIRGVVRDRGLCINPHKESRTEPGEPWDFLGVRFDGGVIDVCPASVTKLKAKMRRKCRSIQRWGDRKGVPGEKRALAFIRRMNRKLFEVSEEEDMCWSHWYFPLISTDRSLRQIDRYMQECVRYLATGKRGTGKYKFSYEDMKALGYRSLVHEFWG